MPGSASHAEEYELPELPEDANPSSKHDLDGEDEDEDARLLGLEGKPSGEDRLDTEVPVFHRSDEDESVTGKGSNIEALIARVSFSPVIASSSSHGSSDCPEHR